jgi:hypothetical protein
MINSNGESESPCQMPLWCLKYWVLELFIFITDDELLSRDNTVESHLGEKPFSIKRLHMYD